MVAVALCAACMHQRVYEGSALGTIIPSLGGAAHVYTLTNLHPDDDRMVLYTANFQQPGFIPLCSEVTLLRVAGDWMYWYSRMRSFTVEFDADGKVVTVYD